MSDKEWFYGEVVVGEEQYERCYWRRVGFIAFAAIVAVILILPIISGRAHSQEIPVYVAEHDGLTLRMLPSPCADASSLILVTSAPPQYQQGWKASSSDWRLRDGSWRTYDGCWLEIKKEVSGAEDDIFVLVFSDGTSGQALKRDLLRKPGRGT